MNFTKSVATYLATFYFLGMSSYRPIQTEPNKKQHKNLMIIVQTVSMLLCLAYLVMIYPNSPILKTVGPVKFITSFYILCDILKAFCVAMQCIVYERQMREINSTFNKLDAFFVIHLNHRIRWQMFGKKILAYAFIVVILSNYVPYIVVFTVRAIIDKVFITYRIPAQFVHIMQSITTLHVIFYIEALTFYLSQLNCVVKRDMDASATSIRIRHMHTYKTRILVRNKIKCYKSIHFRLWEVSERINEYFGWAMAVIFVHAFVKLVYTAHWMFEANQYTIGASIINIKIIRMFVYVICLCAE